MVEGVGGLFGEMAAVGAIPFEEAEGVDEAEEAELRAVGGEVWIQLMVAFDEGVLQGAGFFGGHSPVLPGGEAADDPFEIDHGGAGGGLVGADRGGGVG